MPVQEKPALGHDVDQYLLTWRGVCPAILQYGMRVNLRRIVPYNYILARQRALGLRRIQRYIPKAQRR
jgi:hypothetical protein